MFTVAKRLWAIIALSAVLAACASPPPKLSAEPMDFETAIRTLAGNLLAQLKANQSAFASLGEVVMAAEPMIDANTAEVTMASRRIDEIIFDETRKQFPKIKLLPLNPESAEIAKYILTGIIKLDSKNSTKGHALYRIDASIIDLKTNLVMASAAARVTDPKLDMTPVSAFKDTPMYTRDKRTEGLIKTVETAPGQLADKEYMSSLTTAALLAEGDRMYDMKNYEKALSYYKEASLRTDGQLMRTYAGMYQIYRKFNRPADAEVAFGRLVALGYNTNNMNIKLMFSVGSTQFIADQDLRSEYTIWLRQIAKHLAKTDSCLSITGHSSRSGSETFNESLSLQRAQYVQKLMQNDFQNMLERSTAIGRGWKENMVGTGSNDMQDAIDRRVEFKITQCR